MEEPLLAAATGTGKKIGGGEESLAVREVKKQLYLAGPLVAGFLLQNLVQMVSVMFVGHLGELALASASLATSFAGVTGFSLLAGMACSLDTLCGQAFGARQHHMLGVYKQRAMLVLALVSVPVAAVWAYTGEILAWCGQDPEIAAGAGSYIRWMIPALFVYGALQCHVRFLQTQNLVVPVMLSSGATALCHPAVCWLLVRGLGLGRNGAALANAISYLANLSFLALYVRLSPSCKATWTEFSAEAFRGIPDFLKLAVPSAVMVCTRVSNELGAGRPEAARLATRVVVLLALAVGASEGLAMVLVSNLWGYAYSNEEEVVRHTARMMPILAVSLVFDGLQCVLSGVVRGCGRQKAGAFINLAAYYLAGIPSAFVLAFVWHLGGMGLWFGIMCGLVVQMLLLLSITLFTNWNKEALKAKDRVFSSALPADTAAA
ncbi:protein DETOXIFICATION 16-like isoform X3 [Panicum hallii]|uniref:protein DETOXIFICATION 16-like isoform X3 n=1 Tax=Panicum hallii TaxID=206008 RepID=UPI000DF4E041|nr:protein DETOXIFICATION 16-like isoform X3 [Panicum hallii]